MADLNSEGKPGIPGKTERPPVIPEFASLVNLASESLGGEAIFCTNDFFAGAFICLD